MTVTGVQTCAFFFSSRRRHTRFYCDWSSDVCSSDLPRCGRAGLCLHLRLNPELTMKLSFEQGVAAGVAGLVAAALIAGVLLVDHGAIAALVDASAQEIGRASCRERV